MSILVSGEGAHRAAAESGRALGSLAPPFVRKGVVDLHAGNAQMRAVLRILSMLNKHRVPWALENPATAYVWSTPEFKKLAAQPFIAAAIVDQCAFGTRWKKRTKVMFAICDVCDVRALALRQ